MDWDLLIVSGGRGSRLGGADKGAITVGGERLLERALGLQSGEPPRHRFVAGISADLTDVVVLPDPQPYAGPAAAVLAAVSHVPSPAVIVLAVDMPGVSSATVERLRAAGPNAVLVDEQGRAAVCAHLVTAQVVAAAAGAHPPRAWRELMAVVAAVPVLGTPSELHDIDTPDDLAAWRVDPPIS